MYNLYIRIATMLIILHGENSFFSKRKLNEIIAQYRTKHKTGLSFFVFDIGFDFFDFKSALETVSMFSEKKLIVLKDVLADAANILDYLKTKNIKDDADTVIVFYESTLLEIKKDDQIKWLLEKPAMVQESKNLDSAKLRLWIESEVARQGGEMNDDATSALILFCGDDMWRLSNEISKLVSFASRVTKENVVLLVRQNIESDVFGAVACLVSKNAKEAIEQFWRVAQQGEDPIKTFGLIVFQFRTLLKVRSVLDKSGQITPDQMAKDLRLHPFVLRKTLPLAKKYTAGQLRQIYGYLLEMDVALKRGESSFEEFIESLTLGLGGFSKQSFGNS